jgi:hypothetical protein
MRGRKKTQKMQNGSDVGQREFADLEFRGAEIDQESVFVDFLKMAMTQETMQCEAGFADLITQDEDRRK